MPFGKTLVLAPFDKPVLSGAEGLRANGLFPFGLSLSKPFGMTLALEPFDKLRANGMGVSREPSLGSGAPAQRLVRDRPLRRDTAATQPPSHPTAETPRGSEDQPAPTARLMRRTVASISSSSGEVSLFRW
jgi:hypothetical protein